MVQITEDKFGLTKQPSSSETETVRRFTFSNRNGMIVQVITYGATITSVKVPDRNGIVEDVVLGFDDMNGNNYDHKFSLPRVAHAKSGRTLEIYSDQPGVQFYTSNYIPDPDNNIYPKGKTPELKAPNDGEPIKGKSGALYRKHGAFALETQKYPDSINNANFPSVVVLPGDVYRHEVVYRFGVEPIIELMPRIVTLP